MQTYSQSWYWKAIFLDNQSPVIVQLTVLLNVIKISVSLLSVEASSEWAWVSWRLVLRIDSCRDFRDASAAFTLLLALKASSRSSILCALWDQTDPQNQADPLGDFYQHAFDSCLLLFFIFSVQFSKKWFILSQSQGH